MFLMSQGGSPEDPSMESVQKAVDLIKEQKDKGQIRRFTGNDYADDLAAGNIIVAQAYSGDVVQLQKDNPDLKFVVPEAGGNTFVDTMVIPYTTQNQKAAEEWINYVYDRANYAKLDRRDPVRAGAVGYDRRAEQDRPGAGRQPADQPAAGDSGQARRLGAADRRADRRSSTRLTPQSPAADRWLS